MDLIQYLRENSGSPDGDELHQRLLLDASKNMIPIIGEEPRERFFEVAIVGKSRFGGHIDMVAYLPYELIIFEGKVIRGETRGHTRKEEGRQQLIKGYRFFKHYFGVAPRTILLWRPESWDGIHPHEFRRPGGDSNLYKTDILACKRLHR